MSPKGFLKALFCIIIVQCHFLARAQDKRVAEYIQYESDIREGGCDIFHYMDESFIVCVSSVKVGTKSERDCQTAGSAKCKRDIISYINGSDITSYMTLKYTEEASESLKEDRVEVNQTYHEYIKESVLGTINKSSFLCGWFSQDKTLYYVALTKPID